MKPLLVIVGNAEPTRNHTPLIDGAAMVIRFNRVPFLHTGMVGSKTTVQVLQNMDFHNGDAPMVNREQTWIISENPEKDFGAKVALANNIQGWTRIYSDLLGVPAKLKAKGGSSGFIVIEYLLANGYDQWFDIALACFTWQGWNGHAWEMEKAFCIKYGSEGRLRIL